jgi:Transposase DDE domain
MCVICNDLHNSFPKAICYYGPSMLSLFTSRFEELLGPTITHRLARETAWLKRKSKISPHEFLFSMASGINSALALTLNAQSSCLSQPVSRQALDQRFTPQAVAFFKAAFAETLRRTLAWQFQNPQAHQLQTHFSAIRLFDSTQCACSDALATLFPACGGGGTLAGIKVLLSYEYCASQLHPLAVLPGKRSDQGLAETACQHIQAGELGLLDKGFYKAKGLGDVARRGGFFIIPWPRSVSVWETNALTGELQPLEVAAQLKATLDCCHEWSSVVLGQEGDTRLSPVRLVAYRLAAEAAGRQRANLREKCRTHGRQPTAVALELAGWLILMTNVPSATLPTAAVGYLYRVRWQIELVFKQWKSVFRLDVLPSENDHRVQCELWARLLASLLSFVWHQHLNAACLATYQREISFSKMAKQLQQKAYSLTRTLFRDRVGLRSQLREIWNDLLKLARKERQPSRPTTWENLFTHWLDQVAA